MKLFRCMFQNKIQRVVSVFVAVSILLSALVVGITPSLLSVKADDETNTYVLRIEPNSTGWPFFGQWVSLEEGKTYVYSNCFLPGTDPKQYVYKGQNETEIGNCEVITDDAWWRQGLKFTVPSDALDDPDTAGRKLIWVGFRGYSSSKPLYYYDFELYNVENPEVNLLKDAELKENGTELNKEVWMSPYKTAIKTTLSKATLKDAGGLDIFKKEVVADSMVLKLEPNSTGMPWFGQWVTLEKGKTYIFSNCYLPSTDVYHRIYYKHTDGQYDLSDLEGETVTDPLWSRYGTKFTIPMDAPDDGNGKVLIWAGLRGYKVNKPLYYYDFKLYDVENADVNLFKDGELKENGPEINKAVWQTPGGVIKSTYSKVTLKSVGGEDIFKNSVSPLPMALKLEPNTTGMPFFGQWVTLEIGKTYTYSVCYLPGTNFNPRIYLDTQDTEFTDYEISYDREWSKCNVKFTVPSTAVDIGNGKTSIWVGMRGYKYDSYLYYYNFELYDVEKPDENLMQDSTLQENNLDINTSLWKSPYNTAIKDSYSKVTLESIGGEDLFKRTGDVGPKMMYYVRTSRGPNNETYGCFTLSIPEELHIVGQNYIFQFDSRTTKGMGPTNFRCGAIDPALALDENNTIAPASIDGYTYTFNLRFTDNMQKRLSFMMFVPENTEGYISNIYMYKADSNFNKISDRDMLKSAYADFSQFEADNYVDLYAKQGGCIGTETGKLVSVPEYFFELGPDVPVPAGDKMMSYASVWGTGTIAISLPHTAQKGSVEGKNYIVSLDIRPTTGRDPSKFFSTGINGEHVQVYPVSVDGYKYTFNLTERYNFALILEFPIDCEGYISNLQMIEADTEFKPLNSVNHATAFGKNGKFTDTTIQKGMEWEGITFKGGFANTFVDTRALENELKNGTLGNYGSTGGIWPIPANYFVAEKDENWADAYMSNSGVENGTVIGKIEDLSGNPINNCTIVLKSMQNMIDPRRATSDKNGEFSFADVPIDGYEVSVISKDGNEVLGDMFLWVEENNDVVNLSLVYDEGEALDVIPPENSGENEALPEENNGSTENTPEENNGSTEKAPQSNSNSTESPEENNVLIWVLIGGGVLVALAAVLFIIVFVKKKKIKASK